MVCSKLPIAIRPARDWPLGSPKPPFFSNSGGLSKMGISWEEAKHALPPHWVDMVDEVNEDIRVINNTIDRLRGAHKTRLMVRFDESEGTQERTIEILTQQVTGKFREAEQKLKRIGTAGGQDVSGSEMNVRKNIMRSMAVKLQDLSMEFRKCQKSYLAQLKKQKGVDDGLDNFLGGGGGGGFSSSSSSAEDADVGFSDGQMLYLEQVETEVEERDQEIQNIAKNIEELATIFKELAVLVIDQARQFLSFISSQQPLKGVGPEALTKFNVDRAYFWLTGHGSGSHRLQHGASGREDEKGHDGAA